jgi:CRP/FNR family transcriptional regulator
LRTAIWKEAATMSGKDALPERIEVLASVPYFADLSEGVLGALARAAVRHDYAAGQIVFLEGAPCVGLYVVEDGWLKSYKISLEGREQVIRFVGPSEAFNEVGVLAGVPNQVSVAALQPSIVWIVQREMLLRQVDAHPQLARAITQNLASRVLHLLNIVEDLSLRTVEARLARLLCEHAEDQVLQRRRWTTQAQMAARLGTVLDVVNRALVKLADEGLIQVERHQIQILDLAALRERAMLIE